MKVARGMTMIELMITIAIVALLMTMAAPMFTKMFTSSSGSQLVNQFAQDMAWVRNTAATSDQTVTMTLSTSTCTWTAAASGTAANSVSAHSMTTAQLANFPTLTCSLAWSGTAPTGNVLSFNTQGQVTTSSGANATSLPTLTVQTAQGQTWTVTVLASGSALVNSGTAQ
ncbi:MAG: prepilin-type N-terminal cleavage/methylation domain-containing protein [Burkholderiaceae bacterium]|nr:prepilin-type N-terminal cleavage/methylation domain-containing protein [Roseateles sp.]MBV8469985.1 prepilin-type N-terminal cleavage/methylation domain-containing protein [Burkholderiaceae bacterium]